MVRQREASWEDIDRSGIKRAKAEVRIFRVTTLFSTHPRLLSLISGDTPRPLAPCLLPHTPSFLHPFTSHFLVRHFVLLSRRALAFLGLSVLLSVSSTPQYSPMPRIDPPYPSFTFVLSKPLPRNDRSSRLPAYRASHMGRYHPYARVAPTQCQDRLMVRVRDCCVFVGPCRRARRTRSIIATRRSRCGRKLSEKLYVSSSLAMFRVS